MELTDIIDKDVSKCVINSVGQPIELTISDVAPEHVSEDIVMSTYVVLIDDFQTPILFRSINSKINEVLKGELQ